MSSDWYMNCLELESDAGLFRVASLVQAIVIGVMMDSNFNALG